MNHFVDDDPVRIQQRDIEVATNPRTNEGWIARECRAAAHALAVDHSDDDVGPRHGKSAVVASHYLCSPPKPRGELLPARLLKLTAKRDFQLRIPHADDFCRLVSALRNCAGGEQLHEDQS